jgi:hypothetical protein
MKGQIAANRAGAMNNDLGLRYQAVGDALAEQVRAGRMSDAQAKAALANELARANTEFSQRVGAGGTICVPSGGAVLCN